MNPERKNEIVIIEIEELEAKTAPQAETGFLE